MLLYYRCVNLEEVMPRKKKNDRFTFKNGKGIEYEILFRKPDKKHFGEADGICTDPDAESPKIHINPYLTKQSELNTVIHEVAHAFFWDKSEKEVYKFANTLSRFLYTECGWRKTERSRNKVFRGK